MHNHTLRPLRTTYPLLAALAVGFFATSAPAWGQVINENLKLLASDGAKSDKFGWSIAIDSGVIAVGAQEDNGNIAISGSAYLFDASTGALIAKLLPGERQMGARLGTSIAITDGVVAAGAPYDNENGISSGSAYLFNATTGTQIAKLLPDDGVAEDEFGISIAIGGGVVAVGAWSDDDSGDDSGSVYLFDAATGVQLAKLLPDDGAENERFGSSVAIENNILAVGAQWDDASGFRSGSAYLFDTSTGAQLFKLLPSDGGVNDYFGASIAIDCRVVAVGAPIDGSGAAYVFDVSTGDQIAKLVPSDSEGVGIFGGSVAVDNGFVVVGAWGDRVDHIQTGSAYLFNASTGVQIARLLASDGAGVDRFGSSIAIDTNVIAVGAFGDDDSGSTSGSAYVFEVKEPKDVASDAKIDSQD